VRLLAHDIDKLGASLAADERLSVSSAAQAWHEQHPFAQKFVVRDPNVAKYFPVSPDTEIIKEAFTPRPSS
jgi:hypothetical protein